MDTRNCGRTRPNEGMISSMMRARNVTSQGARGALMATALLAVAMPLGVQAQALRGNAAAPPPTATSPAPPAEAAPAPPAPTAPRAMSESVAAIVNDDVISTYDLAQRMRLLIA